MIGFRRRPEQFKQTIFRALFKVRQPDRRGAAATSTWRGRHLDAARPPHQRGSRAASSTTWKNQVGLLGCCNQPTIWRVQDSLLWHVAAIEKQRQTNEKAIKIKEQIRKHNEQAVQMQWRYNQKHWKTINKYWNDNESNNLKKKNEKLYNYTNALNSNGTAVDTMKTQWQIHKRETRKQWKGNENEMHSKHIWKTKKYAMTEQWRNNGNAIRKQWDNA